MLKSEHIKILENGSNLKTEITNQEKENISIRLKQALKLFIEALPRIVTVPDTTALWFKQQLAIEKGELSVDEFLDEIEKFVAEQIEVSKSVKLEVKGEPCSCGNGVLVLKKFKDSEFFACTAYLPRIALVAIVRLG